MRKTFEDMKIPLDVLHIPDIPTTTSKVSLAGIKKCSYPIIHSHKRQIFPFMYSVTVSLF